MLVYLRLQFFDYLICSQEFLFKIQSSQNKNDNKTFLILFCKDKLMHGAIPARRLVQKTLSVYVDLF